MIARRLIHGCAAVCSRLSPGDAFAMPTLLHVAASARLFLDAWYIWPCLGLILIAWRAWFDLAAFWISGIHARALAAFGHLTFVGCFDAGCRAFRLRCFCALVSENATRGPIAARYSLRKEQSGVRDGSHHDKSAGRSCVVAQGFDFIHRWRGPLLAFSASKAVIFCNRAPLRHFPTSPHVTRSA